MSTNMLQDKKYLSSQSVTHSVNHSLSQSVSFYVTIFYELFSSTSPHLLPYCVLLIWVTFPAFGGHDTELWNIIMACFACIHIYGKYEIHVVKKCTHHCDVNTKGKYFWKWKTKREHLKQMQRLTNKKKIKISENNLGWL